MVLPYSKFLKSSQHIRALKWMFFISPKLLKKFENEGLGKGRDFFGILRLGV